MFGGRSEANPRSFLREREISETRSVCFRDVVDCSYCEMHCRHCYKSNILQLQEELLLFWLVMFILFPVLWRV
ncbi:hypothetical protein HanIR_Chr04g0201841 [Helianthus annuus]|nr:hypothetical protein HanIR_Chr04g0201841 [Helianthus annuus]